MAQSTFQIEAELAVSIRKTLDNAEERMDSMFDDDALCEDAARWEDFGYFIQNCREYLGHVDIGLPLSLLDRADDCARKLGNLDKVFEGAGVATAGRVGRVLGAWHGLQSAMASSETAVPRTDASYVSALDRDLGSSSSAKRRTFAWVNGISRYSAIALASGRFELPAINFIESLPRSLVAPFVSRFPAGQAGELAYTRQIRRWRMPGGGAKGSG